MLENLAISRILPLMAACQEIETREDAGVAHIEAGNKLHKYTAMLQPTKAKLKMRLLELHKAQRFWELPVYICSLEELCP
jgi:hypothetical protein